MKYDCRVVVRNVIENRTRRKSKEEEYERNDTLSYFWLCLPNSTIEHRSISIPIFGTKRSLYLVSRFYHRFANRTIRTSQETIWKISLEARCIGNNEERDWNPLESWTHEFHHPPDIAFDSSTRRDRDADGCKPIISLRMESFDVSRVGTRLKEEKSVSSRISWERHSRRATLRHRKHITRHQPAFPRGVYNQVKYLSSGYCELVDDERLSARASFLCRSVHKHPAPSVTRMYTHVYSVHVTDVVGNRRRAEFDVSTRLSIFFALFQPWISPRFRPRLRPARKRFTPKSAFKPAWKRRQTDSATGQSVSEFTILFIRLSLPRRLHFPLLSSRAMLRSCFQLCHPIALAFSRWHLVHDFPSYLFVSSFVFCAFSCSLFLLLILPFRWF